jgi:hypothetical protein
MVVLLACCAVCQAGVVTLGQPLVVWARQAKVTLKVTQIIHDSTAAGPSAAAAAAGQQLHVKDVARLDQGTELHIAPKPRVAAAAAGSNLAPGELPLDAAAAAAEQRQANGATQQQQQQQRKPLWLRVASANKQHLLATTDLPGTNGANDNSNSSSSSVGPGADSGCSGASAAVTSWLTTAVHISTQTAKDLALQPGEVIRLYSSSSSRGQSVLPLQSLVVTVLLDESVAWGHVALSPPLQQGLGLWEHQFVKLRVLRKQKQLQQLPGFLLHPLMSAASSSSSSSSNSSGSSGLEGLLAAASTPASGQAAAAAGEQAARSTSADAARRADVPPTQQQQWQQQQQQQTQRAESFSGPGLVFDTVKALLTTPLQVMRLQSSLQQQAGQLALPKLQQQQQGRGQGHLSGAGAGAGATSAGDSNVDGVVPDALVQPEVAGAALLSWMQLQLAAAQAAVAAASEESGRGSSRPEQDAAAVHGPLADCSSSNTAAIQGADAAAASGSMLDVCFPVCGPLLVHFRVSTQQQQQQQQQEGGTGSCDHLLLLVPLGEQHQGSAGVHYLPGHLLLPPTATAKPGQQQQQQQQQRIVVQVSKALAYEPTAAGGAQLSQVAQQHSQYVSCIYKPSLQDGTPNNTQQQQQQQQVSWLDPAEYPWLNPALQAGVQRLQPRLDLLTWQSWQSVELPLPGGVLLVGGSEGGRVWLMRLMGQEAATKHGAHVLKVGCSWQGSGSFVVFYLRYMCNVSQWVLQPLCHDALQGRRMAFGICVCAAVTDVGGVCFVLTCSAGVLQEPCWPVL